MNRHTHLSRLTNDELIARLKAKVKAERETLVDILDCLREVELRKLYLERGYSSLFAFVTQELGYSESAALRRIDAMRLGHALPEVNEKIKEGVVNLSTIGKLSQFIRQKEKINETRIPVEEKKALLAKIEGQSARATESFFITLAPETLPEKLEKARPLTEEFTELKIIVSKDFITKLDRVRELHGHIEAAATRAQLMEYVMDFYLKKKDPAMKEHKEIVKKPMELPPTRRWTERSRNIPQAVRREVFKRNAYQCSFTDLRTGRRCESRHRLEIDHQIPFAMGGSHTLQNLTVLCSAHNKLAAVKQLGPEKMFQYLPGWKNTVNNLNELDEVQLSRTHIPNSLVRGSQPIRNN